MTTQFLVSSPLNELISALEKEGNIATHWFRDNSMIVTRKVSGNNN